MGPIVLNPGQACQIAEFTGVDASNNAVPIPHGDRTAAITTAPLDFVNVDGNGAVYLGYITLPAQGASRNGTLTLTGKDAFNNSASVTISYTVNGPAPPPPLASLVVPTPNVGTPGTSWPGPPSPNSGSVTY